MTRTPLLLIDRFLYEPFGTYGKFSIGAVQGFTLELPWLENATDNSCIPEGLYKARVGEYSAGNPPYPDIELIGVPGREAIEMHAANRPDELMGCLAPAEHLVWRNGIIEGASSKQTLRAILDQIQGATLWVLVRKKGIV